MLRILFVLFILVPLVELYVLIEVGSGIGGLATILLCLSTAALGGLIIRVQGMQTLLEARQNLASMQQEKLAENSMHGLMLVVAGILLFFPGLITDIVGFLLLVPAIRRLLMPKPQGGYTSPRYESSEHRRYPNVEVIDVEVIKKD